MDGECRSILCTFGVAMLVWQRSDIDIYGVSEPDLLLKLLTIGELERLKKGCVIVRSIWFRNLFVWQHKDFSAARIFHFVMSYLQDWKVSKWQLGLDVVTGRLMHERGYGAAIRNERGDLHEGLTGHVTEAISAII
ncbi:hypothetical protein PVK06_032264 [Gossypium arboreum]|uniref:Uncharacterized protein n=1 Tax=Gossypium arboreum TaxID=29729 RepID=A0ABR0NTE9_GOSAR|nr:hypothetical protein PVK06_032264 [Gossypium arboreum]